MVFRLPSWLGLLLLLLKFSICFASRDSDTVTSSMMEKITRANGFFAALDQSGGSTPKALQAYGIPDDSYVVGEESMFDAVHRMRTRIIISPAFSGDKVRAAILFEGTMDREIEDMPTGEYLWKKNNIVPFVKIDKGLAAEMNGVQLMNPIPDLGNLLERIKSHRMFGTKMRSLIKEANREGIQAIVDQQFNIGKLVIACGLLPIIEPEVDIHSSEKEQCEDILRTCLVEHLDKLGEKEQVILKLSLPSIDNFYAECIQHPRCLCVVALSGGYSRSEACEILSKNHGMVASFSRALVEGISHGQDQHDFDIKLEEAIDEIFNASNAGK